MNAARTLSDQTLREDSEAGLEAAAYYPLMPRSLGELRVSYSLLADLMLRHLRAHGVSTFTKMHERMKVSPFVVQALFEQMRKQRIVEAKGFTGLDYSFDLTEAGRRLTAERSETCKYVGPAPVSLEEYRKAVKAQAARIAANRARLRDVFADLVVSDGLLDQLGPALISQQALFLYGPTGNGKTTYSERLIRVYRDSVVVPYAVEVDGQIVTVYDPVVHRPVKIDRTEFDPRWVVCRRPCIIGGGELVASSFDLRFDQASGTYLAPLQMRANNGILIIDDFGRQTMSPRELLNRWIVPLDRRVDYLSLTYGIKFEIPFELLVVFSTNLNPTDLVDEAFLRRIPNKVYIGDVDDETFDLIFKKETGARQIPWDATAGQCVRRLCKAYDAGLRACYPADICKILVCISEYEERPVNVTATEIERAVALYFTERSG